jgi:hypothetical protein
MNLVVRRRVRLLQELGSWGAEMRSCSSAVFMEETAEPIEAADLALLALADDVQTRGRIRAALARVPGADDDGCSGRHRPEAHAPGALADDQQPVKALGAGCPDPSLREGVRVGRLYRRDLLGGLLPEYQRAA